MTSPLSPDPQQERVLAHDAGALLVTGDPGTGKTAILRERFARLLEGGADPERVAFVVGSAPARNAERDALLARFQGSLPELRVVTVHGLARHVLNARFRRLDYPEPPDLLPAGDQFALVQELLNDQDPAAWPAYGHMLGMRAFADEVRQFLSRAQEALLSPEDIEARAEKAGLTGWNELARFYREYQDVIDGRNVVDFAALLQRAAQVSTDGEPLLDHLLVDDYQDTTLAAEAIVAGLAPPDLIVAGDPEAHVFSFQGATDIPIRRFAERFGGADVIELETPHRAGAAITVEAWTAPHTSEEHAAIARELRRLHVEEGVPWNELAVVVRRQGSHVGSLLRALDDAGVPRALPESGMALTAEPATFPYVLALRWLTADADAREQLIESVLTSDLVRLSPAAARGVMRAAQAVEGTVGAALEHTEGLTQAEAAEVDIVRDVLARAATVADRSVLDAFRILWQDLPYSARLVADAERSSGARREIDVVVGLSDVVAEAGDSPDPSTEAFVRSLDAGEHGPGYRSIDPATFDAVRVLTAHGAVGAELDTVVVAGAVEGNFPSLSRPEPMFDLAALERPISQSERNRARLEDERRLFRMMLGRARTRVVLTASETHADGSVATSRFVDEQGIAWTPIPQGPFEEPVSVREATATWRRTLADLDVPRARRLAALEGLAALGVDPSALVVPARMDRHRRAAARDHPGVVLQALDARELRAAVRAVRGAGSRRPRRLPGMGRQDDPQDHRGLRERRGGAHAREAEERGRRPLAPAGVPVHRRLGDVEAAGEGPDAAELVRAVRRVPGHRHRARVRVRVRRRDAERLHRPDRARPARVRDAHHRLQDRRHLQHAQGEREPAARHLLPGRAGG